MCVNIETEEQWKGLGKALFWSQWKADPVRVPEVPVTSYSKVPKETQVMIILHNNNKHCYIVLPMRQVWL